MPAPTDKHRRRPTRTREAGRDFEHRIAVTRERGDLNAVVSLYETRNRELQNDNFDLRKRNRALVEQQADAAKVPEGKVMVEKKQWDDAQAAQAALTKLGVDVKTLEAEYPKGRDALLDASTHAVAQAERLSEQGSAALKRVVKDHKLTLVTRTVKDGDKDVSRAYAIVDGKDVPLRDHVKQQFAEFEPMIFAGANTASSTDARRMPPTGKTQTPPSSATPPAGAPNDIARGVSSVLARYRRPEMAKPAGSA